MMAQWINWSGSADLLIFFNGWGMDRRIGDHLLRQSRLAGLSSDLLVCYDYRTLEAEPGVMSDIGRYRHITLVAWSFGVWAAHHSELPPIERAIAINGTLSPVDARKGISPEVFEATLATYCVRSRQRFYRRMCGSPEELALFETMAPLRTAGEQQEELISLKEQLQLAAGSKGAAWNFNHAIIGGRDLVFLPEQQYHAWKGVPQTVIADMPHFPFFHFPTLQEVLECIR